MRPLKEILGDTIYSSIASKLGDMQAFVFGKDEKVLVDDGNLIPKYRLDEQSTKIKDLSTQIENYETELKDLKKSATGNKELTEKIEALQAEQKTLKEESAKKEVEFKKQFAIKEHLLNSGVNDPDAREMLATKIEKVIGGLDKVEIDDKGQIKGFAETLKPIKENPAFLGMFGEIRHAGQEHGNGGNPPLALGEYAGEKNPFNSGKGRNIMLQVKLQKENSELAKRLQEAALKN
jgi:hypothetical protein